MALGSNNRANAYREVVVGSGSKRNAQANSTSWVETDSIFRVGNSPGLVAGEDSDAITTLKNGLTTLTNKAWRSDYETNPETALSDPPATSTDSEGHALVVEGHTRMMGKVIVDQPQGDISMGIFGTAP